MSLRVTILGCGASSGVPMIGCECDVCLSDNPRNRRSRPAILIEEDGTRILVDAGPDLRMQCLANGIRSVDAIIFTHAHADHCHGIDDIRPLNYHKGGSIPAYADAGTMEELLHRFAYAFKEPVPGFGWFRPSLKSHLIDTEEWRPLPLLPVTPIQFFPQWHGELMTLGIRAGSFAYSTDVSRLPEESLTLLQGVDTWVVDCLRESRSPTHAHLELTLEWIERVKPRRAILTHMGHEFDYDALCSRLPAGIEGGYDGLVLNDLPPSSN